VYSPLNFGVEFPPPQLIIHPGATIAAAFRKAGHACWRDRTPEDRWIRIIFSAPGKGILI
jgi:hypothetical protein